LETAWWNRCPGGARSASGRAPRPGSAAVELVRAETGRPQVALTFHGAGELALARQVLDRLRQRGARVTVGTWLAASPDAAKLVLDLGHELGNHTWSHPRCPGSARSRCTPRSSGAGTGWWS
jgi:peptidoglycan/xylan/chitin deacetylase (PgdA/CDA1 family)